MLLISSNEPPCHKERKITYDPADEWPFIDFMIILWTECLLMSGLEKYQTVNCQILYCQAVNCHWSHRQTVNCQSVMREGVIYETVIRQTFLYQTVICQTQLPDGHIVRGHIFQVVICQIVNHQKGHPQTPNCHWSCRQMVNCQISHRHEVDYQKSHRHKDYRHWSSPGS